MKRVFMRLRAGALLLACVALPTSAHAEFETSGPGGKRILLKDNGTWAYLQPAEKGRSDAQARRDGDLLLHVLRKLERPRGCTFLLQLVNNKSYEVRSLVLHYAGYRPNGVLYDTVSAGTAFNSLKPGNKQERQIEFAGLPCSELARVQVVGGDRCEMDDLHKFSDDKGACLARVRVLESDLVRFEK